MTKLKPITVGDAIAHYMEHVAPNRLKPSTLYTTASVMRRWRKELGRVPLSDLTTAHILQVRDQLKTPATQNRYVAAFSSVLQNAIERDWLTENPCRKISAQRVRNADTGQVITPEHERAIMAHAQDTPETYKTLLTLLFTTGCRLGEALRLQLDDIDAENNALTFRDTKTHGADRTIPVEPWLIHELQNNPLPEHAHRTCWRNTMASIGQTYRLHDIRHTFITRALQRGVNPLALGDYVGHSSIAMSRRYLHNDTEALRRQMDI